MRPASAAAELLGSFVFAFTVGCNVLSSNVLETPMGWEIASIACALLATMAAFGPVSGGHFNPAVSLAMLCAGKMQFMDAFAYILLQLAGTSMAMLFARHLLEEHERHVIHVGGRDVVVEMIYTLLLNFVILCVSGKRNNPENEPNQFYGIAASSTLAAGLSSTRLKTGVFNPAITIGLGLLKIGFQLQSLASFVVVQLLAAVAAAGLFGLLRPEEKLSADQMASYVPSLGVRLFSEFLGTTFLMLTLGLSSLENIWAAPCALMGLVYALGDLSGGHFNPAVTAAVVLSRTRLLISSDLLGYWACQVVGCIVAAVTCMILIPGFHWDLGPKAPFQAGAAYIMELTFSIILCLAVLAVSCIKGINSIYSRNFYFGLAIGVALLAGCLCCAKISGACFNPAISLAVAVSSLVQGRMSSTFYASNYCFIELLAGVIAAILFRATHAREYTSKEVTADLHARMPFSSAP
mmetsp:Transcript_82244/g.130009  ORF Transcript_82244/g.130009 Transcript_82244/m.130009 type:complete len:465 (-) Transcript_82244:65-1459(-)